MFFRKLPSGDYELGIFLQFKHIAVCFGLIHHIVFILFATAFGGTEKRPAIQFKMYCLAAFYRDRLICEHISREPDLRHIFLAGCLRCSKCVLQRNTRFFYIINDDAGLIERRIIGLG